MASNVSDHNVYILGAITNYIELHAYQDSLVRSGLQQMNEGRLIAHEEVVVRIKKIGRGRK